MRFLYERCNEPGNNQLPSTTKVTGGREVRTSDLFGNRPFIRLNTNDQTISREGIPFINNRTLMTETSV